MSMSSPYTVIAFYKFITLADCLALKVNLLARLEHLAIKGTILLAEEGINGTIAGSSASIEQIINSFQEDSRFSDIIYKYSYCDFQPFARTKVKIKEEIVKLAQQDIDPSCRVGTYVKPEDWNELISQPDVVVVDTRNQYEVRIGTFTHAIDPNTETFNQLPVYVAENLDPKKHKRIAMFCTGGFDVKNQPLFYYSKALSRFII